MTTKAKSRSRRRPIGRKPAAGTRRGAKRVPGPRRPEPPLSAELGGTASFIDEGGWGQ